MKTKSLMMHLVKAQLWFALRSGNTKFAKKMQSNHCVRFVVERSLKSSMFKEFFAEVYFCLIPDPGGYLEFAVGVLNIYIRLSPLPVTVAFLKALCQ